MSWEIAFVVSLLGTAGLMIYLSNSIKDFGGIPVWASYVLRVLPLFFAILLIILNSGLTTNIYDSIPSADIASNSGLNSTLENTSKVVVTTNILVVVFSFIVAVFIMFVTLYNLISNARYDK